MIDIAVSKGTEQYIEYKWLNASYMYQCDGHNDSEILNIFMIY